MTDTQSSIQVLDRAVSLLQAMGQADEPLSLKVLAAETQLHTSTAHRILAALQVHDFVERNERGNYQIGSALTRLSSKRRGQRELSREARPIMEWLRDQVNETVNLTVREGDEMVYVERAVPTRMMRIEQVIGSRAPLHVTAVGKLMLGEQEPDQWQRYAKRTKLPAYTKNTLASTDQLQQAVLQCQACGYAYDNEEAELGVGCIGVLIRDSAGIAMAGLSISAPIERRQDAWIPLLQDAAKRIAQKMA